ncbi:MAG: hypothetical protein HQL83_14445 [Magnetococcales bacterium]|nr:hypothetical protein [Magnetococcales bacterium]
MKRPFQELLAKIDARSKNERIYILAAILIVFGSGWNALVRQPLVKKQGAVEQELKTVRGKIDQLMTLERQILANKDQDVNRPLKEKMRQKQEELGQLERALENSARNFLSPGEMTQALRRMLGQMNDVTLVGMESLPGEGVRLQDIQQRIMQATAKPQKQENSKGKEKKKEAPAAAEHEPAPGEAVTLYRHGLNVTLEGNFLEIMRYLKKMESLPWTFYWGGLDYSVSGAEGKTTSRAKVFLSTMSFTDGYIGIDPDLTLTGEQLAMMNREGEAREPVYDPTVPDAEQQALQGEAGLTGDEADRKWNTFRLTSILNSKARKVAIINGRPLGEKESFGGITVLAIHPMSVHILHGKRQQEIFLKGAHSLVNKHLVLEKKR